MLQSVLIVGEHTLSQRSCDGRNLLGYYTAHQVDQERILKIDELLAFTGNDLRVQYKVVIICTIIDIATVPFTDFSKKRGYYNRHSNDWGRGEYIFSTF